MITRMAQIACAAVCVSLLVTSVTLADAALLTRRIVEGNDLFARGELSAAIGAYESALELNPRSPTALYNLAMTNLAMAQSDPDATTKAMSLLNRVAAMPGAEDLARRAQFNLGVLQARRADAMLDAALNPATPMAGSRPSFDDAITAFEAAGAQLRTLLRDARAASPAAQPSGDLIRSLEYTRRRLHEARTLRQAMEQLSERMNDAAEQMEQQAEEQEGRARQLRSKQQPDAPPESDEQRSAEQTGESESPEASRSDQAPADDSADDSTPDFDSIVEALNEASQAVQRARDASEQAGGQFGGQGDPSLDATEQRIRQSQRFAEQGQIMQNALQEALERMSPAERERFHDELAETLRELAEQMRDQRRNQAEPEQQRGEPVNEDPQAPDSPEEPSQSDEPPQSDTGSDSESVAEEQQGQTPGDTSTDQEAAGEGHRDAADDTSTRSDEDRQRLLREILEREAEIREHLDNHRRRNQRPPPGRVERDW